MTTDRAMIATLRRIADVIRAALPEEAAAYDEIANEIEMIVDRLEKVA